jgi:hypothetical protein
MRIYGGQREGTRYFCSPQHFASREKSSLAKCLIHQVTLFSLCAHGGLLKVRPLTITLAWANFKI